MASQEPIAIELNDMGIVVADRHGLSSPSPGIAFWNGERLLVGEPALLELGLNPGVLALRVDPVARDDDDAVEQFEK